MSLAKTFSHNVMLTLTKVKMSNTTGTPDLIIVLLAVVNLVFYPLIRNQSDNESMKQLRAKIQELGGKSPSPKSMIAILTQLSQDQNEQLAIKTMPLDGTEPERIDRTFDRMFLAAANDHLIAFQGLIDVRDRVKKLYPRTRKLLEEESGDERQKDVQAVWKSIKAITDARTTKAIDIILHDNRKNSEMIKPSLDSLALFLDKAIELQGNVMHHMVTNFGNVGRDAVMQA